MNNPSTHFCYILLLTLGLATAARAQLFVSNAGGGNGYVNEYTLGGQVIADPLADTPNGDLEGIAISGNNLYTADAYSGTIGLYNVATGSAINSDYINLPFGGSYGIAATSNMLYVTNGGTIYAFNTSGSTPVAAWNVFAGAGGQVAVSGNNLYALIDESTVEEFNATTGAVENSSLISNLYNAFGIAISGDKIYTSSYSGGNIGEYTTSGQTVNADLVQGVPDGANGLAVANNEIYVADIFQVQVYNATNGLFIQTINSGMSQADGVVIATPEPRSFFLGLVAFMLLGIWGLRRASRKTVALS